MKISRIVLIVTLVVAGELIFGLPFHTARFFRPTLLDVFGFTNTQLGGVFAAYGVLAMLCYFPGGALADRYPARSLMAASLIATAIGGAYMATIPGPTEMALLYAYWGVTTIFLFWGALIRATRDWGGSDEQGFAFGFLDAGRGGVAAGVAAFAVVVFASLMPVDVVAATDDERRSAFQVVILLYSLATFLAGVACWFVIPHAHTSNGQRPNPLKDMLIVVRRPVVWAMAAVIVCAYCGFKGLDNYSLYAQQVLGMNEVDAARLSTWGAYTRPFAAIAAGLIADRFDASRSILVAFVVLLLVYAPLSLLTAAGSSLIFIYANIFVSFLFVFALRGIYFALLEENRTPVKLTGAAVGLASLIGFSPDVFFGLLTGHILDATPGSGGFRNYFLFLAGVAAAGIASIAWLIWLKRRGMDALWPSASSDREAAEINGLSGRS